MNPKDERKQVNSHVQMPKFILKRFENQDHKLYCYDALSGSITIGCADSINAEIGYFSETVEKILNKSIEQPFSNVLRYIDTIDFDSKSFSPKHDFVENTRVFLNALLARNPNTFKGMRRSSIYLQLHDLQSQHDIGVLSCIDVAIKNGYFNDYYPTFTVNKTKVPFVLPICGFYWYNNNRNINLPICPWLAITMVNSEMLERLIKNNIIRMYLADKESEIHRLNYFAFQEQVRQGYGNVVAPEFEALVKMQEEGSF